MKRLLTAILGIAVLVIVGCDLTVPNSVTVEIDQSDESGYQIPAGERTVVVSDFWDIGTTLDDVAAGVDGLERVAGGITTPQGKIEALSLTQNLINIDVDDFAGETLSLDGFTQTIDYSYTAPEVDLASDPITTNVEPIALPSGISIPNIPLNGIPEIAPVTGVTQTVPLPSPITSFTSVTFDQGSLSATVTATGLETGNGIKITSVAIVDTSGTPIQTATGTPINSGGTVTFNLNGITLPNDFEVELTFDLTGSPADTFDLNTSFVFGAGVTLSAADGVDLDPYTITGTHTIPIGSGLEFSQATIGTGSISLNTELAPGAFTNVQMPMSIDLLQGATTIVSGWDPGAGPLDLAGETIQNADIEVSYTITVDDTGSPASFTLDTAAGADEVTSEVTASITEFSQLVVADSVVSIPALTPISETVYQELQDLIDTVTS